MKVVLRRERESCLKFLALYMSSVGSAGESIDVHLFVEIMRQVFLLSGVNKSNNGQNTAQQFEHQSRLEDGAIIYLCFLSVQL